MTACGFNLIRLHREGNEGTADDTSAISIILLSASMLSLVISLIGVKWWFRHRLTLEQAPQQVESPVLLRTTSATEIRENCARGVYRQSTDIEALVFSDNSTKQTNSGVKAKTNTSE